MTITITRIREFAPREVIKGLDLDGGLGFGRVVAARAVVDTGALQGLLMAHRRRYASAAWPFR